MEVLKMIKRFTKENKKLLKEFLVLIERKKEGEIIKKDVFKWTWRRIALTRKMKGE
jgi:hypothetical protein